MNICHSFWPSFDKFFFGLGSFIFCIIRMQFAAKIEIENEGVYGCKYAWPPNDSSRMTWVEIYLKFDDTFWKWSETHDANGLNGNPLKLRTCTHHWRWCCPMIFQSLLVHDFPLATATAPADATADTHTHTRSASEWEPKWISRVKFDFMFRLIMHKFISVYAFYGAGFSSRFAFSAHRSYRRFGSDNNYVCAIQLVTNGLLTSHVSHWQTENNHMKRKGSEMNISIRT